MNSMNFEPKDLIVNRPKAMTKKQKIGGLVTLLLFWAILFHLFRPVLVTFGLFFFEHIFNTSTSTDEILLSEILRPIHVFMLIIMAAMLVMPFWIVFKEIYSANRSKRSRLNIEKIVIPDDMSKTQQIKLPKEIATSTQSALKITCHFDNKSNINSLVINGNQSTAEKGEAEPITYNVGSLQ